MSAVSLTSGAEIRSQLSHPVIDSDGHMVEVSAVIADFVRDIGGASVLACFEKRYTPPQRQADIEERRVTGRASPTHWFWSADALDRATAMLPKLYHERMDELGMDFGLVYPSTGLGYQMDNDEEMRRVPVVLSTCIWPRPTRVFPIDCCQLPLSRCTLQRRR